MSDENNPTLDVIIHMYIVRYFFPIFSCIGLLGNGLSVYVLFCTKLRYNSSSIYLGALAMSDIGVLVTIFIAMFITWFTSMKYWLLILLAGLEHLFRFLSVWIVVTFTIQRYIVIKWPLLRRSLCTVNRAKIMIIILIGLAILYSIPWLFLVSFTYKSVDTPMKEDEKSWWQVLFAISAIITVFLPTAIIIMFNILIVYIIRKQNRIRKKFILSSIASNDKTRSSDYEASHMKITKMLVIISTVFVCLNVPLQVSSLCFIYGISNIYISIIIKISSILYVINYGINFVLYYATGKNFRKELICMFTKRSARINKDVKIKNCEKEGD